MPGILTRSDEAGGNAFSLSFSSEEPYERRSWDGRYFEILDHAEGALDLSRLQNMGVVLFNHDTNEVIGRVDSANIADGRGLADITFDADERSQTIAEKVRSGTLKGVSVRYSVANWEDVAAGKESTCGRFSGPCKIARKWTPLEVSIVSIPADASVGVGRDYDWEERDMPNMQDMAQPIVDTAPETTEQRSVVESASDATREAVEHERVRTAGIMGLCREFDMDPSGYIEAGDTMESVREHVLAQLIRTRGPISAGSGVTLDEGDKFRNAAVDALLMRGGIRVDNPAEGAQALRGMRLRDLIIEGRERIERVPGAHRQSDEELLRSFYNPSSAFPAIMDQAIERSYVAGLRTVPATFDRWTTRGSLSDFKPTQSRWTAGDAGELLLVPEGGELKHDLPTDEQRPTRKLNTYGRQFTMTRQALINDDIGFLTTVPGRYGASARRTINHAVYSILAKNPVIYDGAALFDSSRENLMAAAAPSLASLNAALMAMTQQKSKAGDTLLISPRYIVCTPATWIYFSMLLGSDTLKTSAMATQTDAFVANPFKGLGIEIIQDAGLAAQLTANGGTGYEWFMVADASTVDTIQVDYLNGVDTPTIRRMEQPGILGFTWDVWLDWGISVLDYRGLQKNPGAQPAPL